MDGKKIPRYQDMVLKSLADKIDDFYLAGGTALSLFYFQHRASFDLDFFTRTFTPKRIADIIDYLKYILKTDIKLVGQISEQDRAKMMVYNIIFSSRQILKIDFVEDVIDLMEEPKSVNGIKILSLKDIYIRKIYALVGMIKIFDETGQAKFIGGRSDAKDFYDAYYLSHIFMPLSRFIDIYCDHSAIEALIRWFRTFNRMEMMDGLLTLSINKKIDYKNMEKHFKKEIDIIIEKEIGTI